MIGTSLQAYVFIRACILFLHYIAPLSILCCVLSLLIRPSAYRIPRALELLAFTETAFYLLVYLPRRFVLQRAAIHPTTLPRHEREELFQKCHENVPDAEQYIRKWFKEAPLTDIRRDNVKEFFSWAFLNKSTLDAEDEEELETYTDKLEGLMNKKLGAGRGPANSLRLTLDNVRMMHRSLIWYGCVAVVDAITCCRMLYYGFHFHRLRLSSTLTVFPFRPYTVLSPYMTPAKTITYWHRPHNAKDRLPILFVHGIGIGLYPYVNFLARINSLGSDDAPRAQIGIIAVEIMPISFRLTTEMPERHQLCMEILQIVKKHGWKRFVLASHSYGSVVSTHLLKEPQLASRIGPVMLIDPVSFLLHLPDVAYNFTCRQPRRANEHQLYYFASMDMGVAHTLARRFFWSENILWKEDVRGHRLAVSLGGRDLIVDTPTVRRYLSESRKEVKKNTVVQEKSRTGTCPEVLWFPHKDHAQVFDHLNDYGKLILLLRSYCILED